MDRIDRFLRTRTTSLGLGLVALGVAAGCVSYAPQQLSGMSTLELCELKSEQGVNLSAGAQRALQTELERRNVECARYATELALRRDARLHELTYGGHDDP